MKFKEAFTLDSGLQPGSPIFETSQGWLLASIGKIGFTNQICMVDEKGKIIWQKSFAFGTTSMILNEDGAFVLDDHGNFYSVNQRGEITSNLANVVPPGRSIMAKGFGDSVYASGEDDSITHFLTDGNIEWEAMEKSQSTCLFNTKGALIASERGEALVGYDSNGEELWRLKVDGFAPNVPVELENGNLVWGLRTADASSGFVTAITQLGKKAWTTKLSKGVDWVFQVNSGYLVIGPLYAAGLDKTGKLKWEQPFDGSRKLYPLGFNDDGRLVLGILNPDGDEESLKITLLMGEGRISEVGKIPLKKNSLVNVSRHGKFFLLGMKNKIVAYRAVTMKEFIEGEGK